MKKIVILIGVLLVCFAGFVAFKMFQPLPDELNLATTRNTDANHFTVGIAPQNTAFRRNDLHAWIVTIVAPDGTPVDNAVIGIDGGMPQHGHGLPTNPAVTQNLGQGKYVIDGVRFNMGGWWEFKLAIQAGDISDTVTFNLVF